MTAIAEESRGRRPRFDPEDYAEEWMFLASQGTRADDIIERCAPSRWWFMKKVMPLVTLARCSSCGTAFNPQKTGLLTFCSRACVMQSERNGDECRTERERKVRSTNRSGYRGVSWNTRMKKWAADIRANGVTRHLGYFEDPKEAARVYDAAAREYHGARAIVNFKD